MSSSWDMLSSPSQTSPSRPSSPTSDSIVDASNPFHQVLSYAAQEWEFRKRNGEENDVIDRLMEFQGLEEIKQQFLNIKSKIDICQGQGRDLAKERFSIVFRGNPGTGKTSVARLYAEFLHSVGAIDSDGFRETSGVDLIVRGPRDVQYDFENESNGVLFVDEAYQLTASYMDAVGRQILDMLLKKMEDDIGKGAVIFAGYKDEMESFIEHNPGLSSRIPWTLDFVDFTEAELWRILSDRIEKDYHGRMRVEDGMAGKPMRIAVRRLVQGPARRSFGNARAVENLLSLISARQAQRLVKEKRLGGTPDYNFFTQEDIIGPDPSEAAEQSQAWKDLQKLIGLDAVKQSVQNMIHLIQSNYKREMKEVKPRRLPLNQLFVGQPGTGKTTVAKLYGRILADLGLLSRGDVVVKTPADFIGAALGQSEMKTKKLLDATVGKVLVIDEAYMLDAGDTNKDQDKFKTGVIDTIVANIQGDPGEDRCIILIGYEDKIRNMFHNVNPGLSRRFPTERPFHFENYSLYQLEQMLQLKMREQEIDCTPEALKVARDMFERALMRPNFANASEVESCLATAKANYEARLSSSKTLDGEFCDDNLEPQDFDPDFESKNVDCRQLMEGKVQSSIVEKMVAYQNRYFGAKKYGLNPRDQVPTNLIFKGFPGTGKKTTAHCMGQILYNMGFLSTSEVIECSATDMLGEYVGQTSPKTKKLLQKALGKILFISEANRLHHGQYAGEALDEMAQFLTQSAHEGRMVVILSGDAAEMNTLMASRSTLSGLFTEEIMFNHLKPTECIAILNDRLGDSRLPFKSDFLSNKNSPEYKKVRNALSVLRDTPGWSNARDMKALAQQITGRFLDAMSQSDKSLVSTELVIECIQEITELRKSRYNTEAPPKEEEPPTPAPPLTPKEPEKDEKKEKEKDEKNKKETKKVTISEKDKVNPPPKPKQSQSPKQTPTPRESPRQSHSKDHPSHPSHPSSHPSSHESSRSRSHSTTKPPSPQIIPLTPPSVREPNTKDSDWKELQAAKLTHEEEIQDRERKVGILQTALRDAKALRRHSTGSKKAMLCAECDSLKIQLEPIHRQIREEKRIQVALEAKDRCVNRYAWVKVSGGYRCHGGGAFYLGEGGLLDVMRMIR
ncbi:hypothetical protein AWENTII_009781 [Aspergillus wentii]